MTIFNNDQELESQAGENGQKNSQDQGVRNATWYKIMGKYLK